MKLRYALVPAAVIVLAAFFLLTIPPAIRGGKSLVASAMVDEAYRLYQQANWNGVIRETTTAICLDPADSRAYVYRGYAYEKLLDWDKSIDDYNTAIRLNPKSINSYGNRGFCYEMKNDWDKAIADFDTQLKMNPKQELACVHLGYIYLEKRDYDRALANCNEAIRLAPNYGRAYAYRGRAYSRKGDSAKAMADFDEAIQLEPDNAATWSERGHGYIQENQWSNAVVDFRHALTLAPASSHSLNELAWLLATSPDPSVRDGGEAVRLATQACTATNWKTSTYLDTLAAAYAESRDFEKAVKYQQNAIAAEPAASPEYAGMQQRLELYRQHQPYREIPEAQKLEKSGS